MPPEDDAFPSPTGAAATGAAAVADEARRAQGGWADRPVAARLAVLRRFRRRMASDTEAMLGAMASRGRPEIEGLVAEIMPLADACRYLERAAEGLLRPRRLGWRRRPAWLTGVAAELRRDPLGVVLVIAPGNYPLLLPGVQILQALAAGNAVIVKPAPGCTAPLALMARWLAEAGLPGGLLHVAGEAVEHATRAIEAGVDKVVLTGSAETGRIVAADLGARLIPSTMELSGNDAVFVLPGAELGLVARALAFGLRFNGSATCIAPRRVFVGRADAPGLESALLALLAEVPPVPVPGPVQRRVAQLVTDAMAQGARPLGETPDLAGDRLDPIVLADARPAMALLRADVFAPVLAIVPVDDMNDTQALLALAGQSPYALGASVFGPEAAAAALAARVDAGSVMVNDLIAPTADPRLPFGGRHRSGWGVTRGGEGLLEMTSIKTVSTRKRGPWLHFDPSGPHDGALMAAVFRLLHGAGATRRGALGALVRAVRRRQRDR